MCLPSSPPPLHLVGSLSQLSAAGSSVGDSLDTVVEADRGGAAAGAGVGEAQGTLTMLLSHCRSSQEGKAFLYDELALSAASGALGTFALGTLIDMLLGEFLSHILSTFVLADACIDRLAKSHWHGEPTPPRQP